MNLGRIEEIAKAADIVISREDWYDIYRSGKCFAVKDSHTCEDSACIAD